MTKEELLPLLEREFANTLKVMKAFPEDKLSFTPHPRSSTARKLMSTLVFGMYLTDAYMFGAKLDRSIFQTYSPDKLSTLTDDFEKASSGVIAKLRNIGVEGLEKEVEFAGSKSTAGQFVLFILLDQIHHRGQMTVYIRLAGGKVPSVYGPSADDPGTTPQTKS